MGLIDKAPPKVVGESPGLLGEGTPAFLTSQVDFLVNWARRNSLWPMPKTLIRWNSCSLRVRLATFGSTGSPLPTALDA